MRARVAVVPPAAFHARPRLLGALEQALPVRFEPRAAGDWRELDAVVRIGDPSAAPPVPCLDAEGAEPEEHGRAATVLLVTGDVELDTRLWGAALTDAAAGSVAPLMPTGPAALLAGCGGEPLWLRVAAGHERIAMAPDELLPGEALRARLEPGRCLALLALVHFLRRVAGDRLPTPPPLRAAFVLDDPNLHWPTYGHVRYSALAGDAATHGYHVAIATVPLDSWFVHPRARRIFQSCGRELSLLVHGNLHDGPELGDVHSEATAARIGADALRRVAVMERRTGLAVSPVMAPPHERLSEPAARGMLACGFEAMTMSRPHPWLDGEWLARPPGAGPLVGWEIAEQIAGGLPVLLRSALSHPREDLVLRAFLDQPLILYGHPADLAGGLDTLREAAAQVNRLGPVWWTSLEDMVRSSVVTRRAGARLDVRLYARRVLVHVPDGVEEIVVSHVGSGLEPSTMAVDRPGVVELSLPARIFAVEPQQRAGACGARPLLRRLASEARDRMAPLAWRGAGIARRPRPV
jgi:hypothetical protein